MLSKKTTKGVDYYREKFKETSLKEEYVAQVVPTGSINVDKMLNGGLRPGIVEVYGPEGVGKSTFAMALVKEITNLEDKNKFAFYIDAEGGILSCSYLQELGIDVSRLIVLKHNDGEQAFDAIEELCKNPNCSLIIVDSVASLMTNDEITGDGQQVGGHARMISRRIKNLLGVVNSTPTACPIVFINQLRANITTMGMYSRFAGEQFTTTGGRAMRYGANLRLEISLKETLTKTDKTKVGLKARIRVVKSRYANPHMEAEYNIRFGFGFSKHMEVLDLCLKNLIIEQNGSWYYVVNSNQERLSFNSKWSLLEELENNKELFAFLTQKCL